MKNIFEDATSVKACDYACTVWIIIVLCLKAQNCFLIKKCTNAFSLKLPLRGPIWEGGRGALKTFAIVIEKGGTEDFHN